MEDYSCGIIPVRVVNQRVEYLVIQHVAGHWGFPKGHPEGDETPLQTAQRECFEETGLSDLRICSDECITQRYSYQLPPDQTIIHKRVDFFLAQVQEQPLTLQVNEIQDAVWLPYNEAYARLQYAEDRQTLDAAHSHG